MPSETLRRGLFPQLLPPLTLLSIVITGCSGGARVGADDEVRSQSQAITANTLSTQSLQVQVETVACSPNGVQDVFQVVNAGTTPVTLSDISIKFWLDDISGQQVVANVWTGGCVTNVNGNGSCVHQVAGVTGSAVSFPACGPDASHQANWEVTISDSDGATLPPGATWSNIQSGLNLANYANFTPGAGDWYSGCETGSTFVGDPHFAVYYQGNLVFSNGIAAPSCRSPQGTQALNCADYMVSSPAVAPVPPETPVTLAVGLPLRNEAGLDTFIEAVSDPTNPMYGQALTVPQFAAAYGATTADYQAATQWAQGANLAVTTYPNNLLVDVQGTIGQLEQLFFTNFVYAERPDGTLFYQPDRCPTVNLPAALDYVGGLTNFTVPAALGNPGTGPNGTLQSSDFRNAYLGTATPCSSLEGDGQTIGVVAFDAFNPGDVTTFATDLGLDVPLAPIPVLRDGVSGDYQPVGESTFDVELALAMAPHAQVVAVEGTQIDSILGWLASHPEIRQITDSHGGADSSSYKYIKEFAAQRQSFFQASGDGGAYQSALHSTLTCGTSPKGETTSAPHVDDSRALADIVLVGGTQLTLTSDGTQSWQSETTWSAPIPGGFFGSGGGALPVLTANGFADPLPKFQAGLTNLVSTASRNAPDVSMPATNLFNVGSQCAVALVCPVALVNNKCPTTARVCPAGQLQSGLGGPGLGTSGAAPLWAGFMALLNEQLANHGLPAVGHANPLFYQIAKTSSYAAAFHDINDNSTNPNACNVSFSALAGWDPATGLGSPQCGLIEAAEIAATGPQTQAPTVQIVSPAPQTVYFTGQALNDTPGRQLQAATTDPVDAPNTATVVWQSDVQGQLGVGITVFPVFTVPGTQHITAVATDSEGVTVTSAPVTVVVEAAPTDVVIVLPTANEVARVGLPISLDGFADFGVGGSVPCGSLTWTDSVPNEVLSQGAAGCSMEVRFIAPGPHQITLSAAATADSAASSASVLVQVVADPGTPYPFIETPVGTAAVGAAVTFGSQPTQFVAQIYDETFPPCVGQATTDCATIQWSASACGGPSVPISAPPATNDVSFLSSLPQFDPFSITTFDCATEVVSLCVTDPMTPSPGSCTTTTLALIWPAR